MVRVVHEEVAYCSSSTSSGKQKKNRSTSQLQFRTENTFAKNKPDQFLLDLQQLANINTSANFHKKSTEIPTCQSHSPQRRQRLTGKLRSLSCLKFFFQTSLKIHNQLTEDDKINYFLSLMKEEALQTVKNIIDPTRENLGEVVAVFRRKYVLPQSMARAKQKFQKLDFIPAKLKLVDVLDEFQQLAKDAFGIAAHAIIEQFMYAKKPPHQKKAIN